MSPADPARVVRYSEASVPTERGDEHFVVYRERAGRKETAGQPTPEPLEHVGVVVGDVSSGEPVLVRIHSECMTGEVFGSLKCECGPQLELALDRIHVAGSGVLVYLRQEGRGIGLGNKLRAYALQESGADTVDANTRLGFPADARSYGVAVAILQDLGVQNVRLMTNNPDKVAALEAAGYQVTRQAHLIPAGEHNRAYLETKGQRFGHWVSSPDDRERG